MIQLRPSTAPPLVSSGPGKSLPVTEVIAPTKNEVPSGPTSTAGRSIDCSTPRVAIGTVRVASTWASLGSPSPFGSLQTQSFAFCAVGAKTNMMSRPCTVRAPSVTR